MACLKEAYFVFSSINFRYKSSKMLKVVRGILIKRKQAPTSDPVFKSIDYLSISLVYKSRTLTKKEEEQEYLLQKFLSFFSFTGIYQLY